MAADFNKPVTTDSYSNVLAEVRDNDAALALGLDPATTAPPANVPANAIRWTSASNKWQKYNGTDWADLAAVYAISISGNAATATTASAAPWSGVTGKPTTLSGYGIADAVPLAGGVSMTGLFSLSGNATTALHPVTKQQAEALANAAAAASIPLAGGVAMTGLFSLSGDPTTALQPATKQYADNASVVKAEISFNGATASPYKNSGFVSLVRDSAGVYTLTLAAARPTNNYVVIATCSSNYGVRQGGSVQIHSTGITEYVPSTTTFRITVSDVGGINFDPKYVSVIVID